MKNSTIPGWIIRLQSGFYTVQTDVGLVTCQLRGRLKRGRSSGDVLSVGDRVEIMQQQDGSGMIEEIVPRTRALVRLDPRPHGTYQQILLSNIDQVVLVFASANPSPRLRMLDRFLVIAEKQGIPATIVANKVDLAGIEAAQALFGIYPGLGYPVIYTSVKSRLGVEELREHLTGKISGLAGPSGVGKSSLLNMIQPELGLAVREVSDMTTKGKHTTVVRQIFALNSGGFVADLPGLKSLALWDTQPEELDGYFPELRDLVEYCQFNDCSHTNEPGCAVLKAVESGDVHPERYESYLRMRNGEE
jgi:ribosome biogenesis GTPase / thiamine phosphate phosphatase